MKDAEARSDSRARSSLPGIALAAFLVAGGVTALWAAPALRWPRGVTLADFRWTARVEEAFDAALPFRELAVELSAALDFALFGQGAPGVVLGEGDWLFSAEELATYPAEEEAAARKLDLVARVGELFAEQGAGLVVALVPSKARIYDDFLGRHRLPRRVRNRYRDYRSRLMDRGVEVPDLATRMRDARAGGELFMRDDSHWSPRGAELVARVLAATLDEGTTGAWRGGSFVTEVGEPRPHPGDLTRFLPLGRFAGALRPAAEPLRPRRTTPAPGSPQPGLLDPPAIPAALVGTSYSAEPRWDFPGALRRALGADLVVAARQREGPFAAMLDYLDDQALLETPPRLVVWEMPERALPAPDGWAERLTERLDALRRRRAGLSELCPELGDPAHYQRPQLSALAAGEPGWLFRGRDFWQGFDPDAPFLPYLDRLVRAFGEQGITLLSAVLPPRAMVHHEAAGAAAPPDYSAARAFERYRAFLDRLGAAGARAPEVKELAGSESGTGEPFYFRRDRHMTPTGGRRLARAVAAALRSDPIYGELEQVAFVCEALGDTLNDGGMLAALRRICGVELPGERFTLYDCRREEPLGPESLLDLAPPEVVLLGSSNSNRWKRDAAHFAGSLRMLTSLDIVNHAFNGAVNLVAPLAFFLSEGYQIEGERPRVVIWEICLECDALLDVDLYRQLIPAIRGVPAGGEALLEGSVRLDEGRHALTLRNEGRLPIAGSRCFLLVESSDLSVTSFEVEIGYRGGGSDLPALALPPRVASSGRFFLELRDDLEEVVESIRIAAPPDARGVLRAAVFGD